MISFEELIVGMISFEEIRVRMVSFEEIRIRLTSTEELCSYGLSIRVIITLVCYNSIPKPKRINYPKIIISQNYEILIHLQKHNENLSK